MATEPVSPRGQGCLHHCIQYTMLENKKTHLMHFGKWFRSRHCCLFIWALKEVKLELSGHTTSVCLQILDTTKIPMCDFSNKLRTLPKAQVFPLLESIFCLVNSLFVLLGLRNFPFPCVPPPPTYRIQIHKGLLSQKRLKAQNDLSFTSHYNSAKH